MCRERENRQLRAAVTDFKTREDGEELFIDGYFAVFNSIYDMGYGMTESIAPGAFTETLADDIRALTNHDTTLVLGRTSAHTLDLMQDERGLWGSIRINPKDQDALNLRARVQRGDVSQCSIGFDILEEETEFRGEDVHWTIKKVRLYEVSVCTFPAYEETAVAARAKDKEELLKRSTESWKQRMKNRLKEIRQMALRALMKGKALRDARKKLEEARAKLAEIKTREADLEKAVEEAETEEEKAAVEEAVTAFETEKEAAEKTVTDLEAEVSKLETELDEIEKTEETPAEDKPEERTAEIPQKEVRTMAKRWKEMSHQERAALVRTESVQNWLGRIRSMMRGEERSISNVGQTIPLEVLPILKENVMEYSKLLKHVNLQRVSGEARQVIQGTFPEAVWTDCCANLNELDLAFYGTEVNCWKIAGYFAICNANIEDSDEDLLADVLQAIGQGIGLGVDKAILYGTGSRMPLGVVTRLAQTSKPAGYSDADRPWVDLHTSNIKTIASTTVGVALFQQLVMNAGAAKGKYSRGEKVWVMNEGTYTYLKAQGLSVNAAGAIVSGVDGTLPVVGGIVEVLEFVPDNVIIGGFFDLYLLAERAGANFATSEHVKFLQDQTVAKGTARYDGKPVIAEGFVAIGVNSTTPDADMTFAPDSANF